MSTNKNSTKNNEHNCPMNCPACDPLNILFYTDMFEQLGNTFEHLLNAESSHELRQAVNNATCEEYANFKFALDYCLSFLEELDNKPVEDYFIEEE